MVTLKKKALIYLIICCCVLQGCVDFNAGKRPAEYINTKWISDNPNVYFEVREEFMELYKTITYGEIFYNGNSIDVYVGFDMGKGVAIRELSNCYDLSIPPLLRGLCEFGEDKFIVEVIEKDEKWFDEDLKEITFIREDI